MVSDRNASLTIDEPDNAALAMMERFSDWDHPQFKKVCVKVANMEIAYKAVSFYLARQVSTVSFDGSR
jgi:clathrin heavy chain